MKKETFVLFSLLLTIDSFLSYSDFAFNFLHLFCHDFDQPHCPALDPDRDRFVCFATKIHAKTNGFVTFSPRVTTRGYKYLTPTAY